MFQRTVKTRMQASPLKPIYDECNKGNSKEKYAKLPEFPRLIDIELTNTCNFRCLMCPTGNHSMRRASGFMEEQLFYKILEEMIPYGTPLRFIRWGEPFLHDKIFDFLRACRDGGIVSHVNTNGSYMDDDAIAQIVGIPLNAIKFSFQGVDRKSYEEMRNSDFFEDLFANIKKLREARGDQTFPHIHVATTITNETPEMVRSFGDKAKEIADLVTVGRTVLEDIDFDAVRIRPHELEKLKKLKKQQSIIKVHPECPDVFDKLNINWDGTLSVCCRDSDNVVVVGDLRTQTLAEIWRSEKLDYYRGMLADMRHDELPLCRTCYDYNNIAAQGLEDHVVGEGEAGDGGAGESGASLIEPVLLDIR